MVVLIIIFWIKDFNTWSTGTRHSRCKVPVQGISRCHCFPYPVSKLSPLRKLSQKRSFFLGRWNSRTRTSQNFQNSWFGEFIFHKILTSVSSFVSLPPFSDLFITSPFGTPVRLWVNCFSSLRFISVFWSCRLDRFDRRDDILCQSVFRLYLKI